MMGIAYHFALHKWRCHVLLKDKIPDERQNSFHLSYFAAELLSDLWLNRSPKMIRKGRGLINHVEFSIHRRGNWVTDPSAGRAPQKPCTWPVPLRWSIDNRGCSLSTASKSPRLKVRDGCKGSISSLLNDHDEKANSESWKHVRTSRDHRRHRKAARLVEITSCRWGFRGGGGGV